MAFRKFVRKVKKHLKKRYTKKTGGLKFGRITERLMVRLVNVSKMRINLFSIHGSQQTKMMIDII